MFLVLTYTSDFIVSFMIHLEGRSCIIFSFSLVNPPKKLLRLINMSLNETNSKVQVGKLLSEMLPIKNGMKQGDALSPFLFNVTL